MTKARSGKARFRVNTWAMIRCYTNSGGSLGYYKEKITERRPDGRGGFEYQGGPGEWVPETDIRPLTAREKGERTRAKGERRK